MATSVINLKTGAKYDVYCGRGGKGQLGVFGNPVVIGQRCPVCLGVHRSGGTTLPCYTKYLKQRLETDPVFKQQLLGLKDKTLACFCDDVNKCHAGVIAKYLDHGLIE